MGSTIRSILGHVRKVENEQETRLKPPHIRTNPTKICADRRKLRPRIAFFSSLLARFPGLVVSISVDAEREKRHEWIG